MKFCQAAAYIEFFEFFLIILLFLIEIGHRNINWRILTITRAKPRVLQVFNKTCLDNTL